MLKEFQLIETSHIEINIFLLQISPIKSDEVDLLNKVAELLPMRKTGTHPPAFVFHGVRGENFQTQDSPSWFNLAEANQVFFYVNDLYSQGLTPADIGIITPYIKQV